MPTEELNPLSSTEYDEIGKALFEKISKYPNLPDGVELDYQNLSGANHIGFFTSPGGKYLWEDVTGGFCAQLPFDVIYRFHGTENIHMLKAEEFLNGLADYLSEQPYPSLTRGRTIEKITMNSITYRTAAGNDGSINFARSGVVKYEKV